MEAEQYRACDSFGELISEKFRKVFRNVFCDVTAPFAGGQGWFFAAMTIMNLLSCVVYFVVWIRLRAQQSTETMQYCSITNSISFRFRLHAAYRQVTAHHCCSGRQRLDAHSDFHAHQSAVRPWAYIPKRTTFIAILFQCKWSSPSRNSPQSLWIWHCRASFSFTIRRGELCAFSFYS